MNRGYIRYLLLVNIQQTRELPVRSIEPAYRQCFNEVVRAYMEEVNKIFQEIWVDFWNIKKRSMVTISMNRDFGMNYILGFISNLSEIYPERKCR